MTCTDTSYTTYYILTFYKPSAHLSKIAHNADKTVYLSLRFAHIGSQRYAAAKLSSERPYLIAKRVVTSLRCLYLRQSLLVVACFLSFVLPFLLFVSSRNGIIQLILLRLGVADFVFEYLVL